MSSLDKPQVAGGYTGLLNATDDVDEEDAAGQSSVSWLATRDNDAGARRSAGYNQGIDDDLNVRCSPCRKQA